jgi:hypothetical protein
LGYDKIPAYWKMGLKEAEDIDFKYTTISLTKVYEIGYRHALQNIVKNGGKVSGSEVTVERQIPVAVPLEQGFPGIYPIETRNLYNDTVDTLTFSFTGTGFIVSGEAVKNRGINEDYVFEAELIIDGKTVEKAKLPTSFTTRRHELFWKYELPNKRHKVTIKVINPSPNHSLRATTAAIFSNKPATSLLISNNE